MNKIISSLIVCSLFLVGSASATAIYGDGLQQVLNDITVENATDPLSDLSSIDVHTDQLTPDEIWALSATGTSVSNLVVQLTEQSSDFQSFGVYDYSDPLNAVEIFNDGDIGSNFNTKAFSMDASGNVYINFVAYTNGAGEQVIFNDNKFGYYLTNGNGVTYYSQPRLNGSPEAPEDHMVAYQGQNDIVQIPNAPVGAWDPNEFILAWEDDAIVSDSDYDDFVVMVESVQNVPEPVLLVVLGLGLAMFGFAGYRKK